MYVCQVNKIFGRTVRGSSLKIFTRKSTETTLQFIIIVSVAVGEDVLFSNEVLFTKHRVSGRGRVYHIARRVHLDGWMMKKFRVCTTFTIADQ